MVRKLFAAALVFTLLHVLLPGAASAASLAPDRASGGDGTITDRATGLTWIADASVAAQSLREAVELVRALNSGRVENYGREHWRVATSRELATAPFEGRSSLVGDRASGRSSQGASFRPVFGSATVAGVNEALLVATTSALVDHAVNIGGDVIVNEAASVDELGVEEPLLVPGFEAAIDQNSEVDGDVRADSVRIGSRVDVSGEVEYNDLEVGDKAKLGSTSTPLTLPVFSMLPLFQSAVDRTGLAEVSVAAHETQVLPAGEYDDVSLAEHATLVLEGGVYELRSLATLEHATVLYAAPVDVRVLERVSIGHQAFVGATGGSGIPARDAVMYVGGVDGTDGALGSLPRAVEIAQQGDVSINLYAPNGTVFFDVHNHFKGAVIARHVHVGHHSRLTVDSFFSNRAPTADPKTVELDGANAIVITLSGSDPDDQSLTFAIESGPSFGTLSVITPIVPDPVEDRETGGLIQPPTTQATVIYTPNDGSNTPDSFTYSVTDPDGGSGSATVSLVAPVTEEPPEPPATVVAADVSDRTRQDSALTVTLSAGAPEGIELTYALVVGSGPANGTLGPVTPAAVPVPRTATVLYTPDTGFLGTDGFQFEVCGTVESVVVCDVGDVSIEVFAPAVEPGPLAVDQSLSGFAELPLTFALQGTAGGSTGGGAPSIFGEVRYITAADSVDVGAAIAGNVADSTGLQDGLVGDNKNNLPGAAPVLISASLSDSGGSGSDGLSRINVEWPLSGFQGATLTSATVTVNTNRGSIDSEDTFWYSFETSGDGVLTLDDMAGGIVSSGTAVATMPVPEGQQQGEDGTFSFDVTSAVQTAIDNGFGHFWVHGRLSNVLEFQNPGSTVRGLQVRSTADGNLTAGLEPQLSLNSDQPLIVEFTLLSLPSNGTLRDASGSLITAVPHFLGRNAVLTYTANAGFVGTDSISFEASDGVSVDVGVVDFVMVIGSCADHESFCNKGR